MKEVKSDVVGSLSGKVHFEPLSLLTPTTGARRNLGFSAVFCRIDITSVLKKTSCLKKEEASQLISYDGKLSQFVHFTRFLDVSGAICLMQN